MVEHIGALFVSVPLEHRHLVDPQEIPGPVGHHLDPARDLDAHHPQEGRGLGGRAGG